MIIGARPEDIVLSQDLSSPGQDYEIGAILPTGPETIIQLERGTTSVIARVGHDTPFVAGQTIRLSYRVDAITIYDANTTEIVTNPAREMAATG